MIAQSVFVNKEQIFFRMLYSIAFVAILLSVWIQNGYAQEETPPEPIAKIEATIDAASTVEINKKILFDASRSLNPDMDTNLNYSWDLGDGTKLKGKEIVHTYKTIGEYTVKLFVSNGQQDATTTMTVFVYNKQYVLLLDSVEKKKSLDSFLVESRKKGISFLLIAPDENSVSPTNDFYIEALLTNIEKLKSISAYVVWIDELRGLEIISSFARQIKSQSDFSLKDTSIIFITTYDLGIMYRVVGRNLYVINPRQIIVIMKDIMGPLYGLMAVPSEEEWFRYITKNTSAIVVDQKTSEGGVWNFFSNMINGAIKEGVSGDIITFLLIIPLITLIIAFLKQVIGLSTSGVYTPLVLTLSLYLIGWEAGVLTLGVIVLGSMVVKFLIQHIRLHYIPRLALIISSISLILLLLIIGFSNIVSLSGIEKLMSIRSVLHVFPFVVLVFTAERFITTHIDNGLKKAFIVLLEIIVVSLISYAIVRHPVMQLWIFAYPELVVLWIVSLLILGRFTGLRLLEYVRFRSILFHTEEE